MTSRLEADFSTDSRQRKSGSRGVATLIEPSGRRVLAVKCDEFTAGKVEDISLMVGASAGEVDELEPVPGVCINAADRNPVRG